MDFRIFLCFFAISLLSFFNCRNSAAGMITEIGINKRFYPKHYTVLPKKLKKLLRIKNTTVPKFLLYELFVSLLFALLFPINTVICLCFNGNKDIVRILIMIHTVLIIINLFYFVIKSTIFKHKQ